MRVLATTPSRPHAPPLPRSHALTLRHSYALTLLTIALCGCAGYKLGPVNEAIAGQKSVHVVPFVNKTLEPRLTDAVTAQVRKELQKDSTFRLATGDEGDVVLSGTIVSYQRMGVSFIPSDVRTVQDYRLKVTAQVTAHERATGKLLFDRPVDGYTLIRVGSDLVSSERQALPLLAQDLAKRVTSLLAEGSW